MANRAVKCSKCKKGIFYLPDGYKMDLKVVCINCHKNTKPKKKSKQTLSASYAKMKKGVRKNIHPTYSFRSATEANFARILNKLKVEWKFEERVFTFNKAYKTKPHVYIMDFEVTKGCKEFPPGFYEIKGYMTPDSRKKLRRLKKCYPDEFARTTVIVYNKYKKADIELCEKLGYKHMLYDELTKRFSSDIPAWE
jgi:predicted nuclease of restriction endonuclease-like RecB superfamily